MNKKFNTVVFIIGATVFNVILIAAVAIILFFVTTLIFGTELLGTEISSSSQFLQQTIIPVIFVLSLVGAFFIYRIIMRQIEKRIDLNKYFEPFFRKKR